MPPKKLSEKQRDALKRGREIAEANRQAKRQRTAGTTAPATETTAPATETTVPLPPTVARPEVSPITPAGLVEKIKLAAKSAAPAEPKTPAPKEPEEPKKQPKKQKKPEAKKPEPVKRRGDGGPPSGGSDGGDDDDEPLRMEYEVIYPAEDEEGNKALYGEIAVFRLSPQQCDELSADSPIRVEISHRFCTRIFPQILNAFKPKTATQALIPHTTWTTGRSPCVACVRDGKKCTKVRTLSARAPQRIR